MSHDTDSDSNSAPRGVRSRVRGAWTVIEGNQGTINRSGGHTRLLFAVCNGKVLWGRQGTWARSVLVPDSLIGKGKHGRLAPVLAGIFWSDDGFA